MKSVTGAFFGSCAWAHDRFTDLDVKPVIIGRPGASGVSCTNKSIGALGLSLIVQIYSPLSINLTGLNCKLKFFGFSDLCRRRKKGCDIKKEKIENHRLIAASRIRTYPLILLHWPAIYKLYYCLTWFPGQFFNFQNRFFTNDTGAGQCQVGTSSCNNFFRWSFIRFCDGRQNEEKKRKKKTKNVIFRAGMRTLFCLLACYASPCFTIRVSSFPFHFTWREAKKVCVTNAFWTKALLCNKFFYETFMEIFNDFFPRAIQKAALIKQNDFQLFLCFSSEQREWFMS